VGQRRRRIDVGAGDLLMAKARGRSSRSGRSSGALPPGFEGFGAEIFGLDEPAPPRPHFNQFEPLANLHKGDELRIAGATFLVHRVIGTYQTDVYKKGVKRPYLLNQIDRDRLAVFVLRGTLESTFAEPPVLIVDVSQVKLVRGYSYSVKSVRG